MHPSCNGVPWGWGDDLKVNKTTLGNKIFAAHLTPSNKRPERSCGKLVFGLSS